MSDSAIELARRASTPRPDDALPAVSELRAHLNTLEAWHVENALRAGWSWAQIAEALGVTKQAAHRKHAARIRSRRETRLTVRAEARRAVQLARDEVRGLGHGSVATVHLLLGVLRTGGPAADALASLGVSPDAVRARVRRDAERPRSERAAISPAARTTLEQALREAVRLGDAHLGAEHLLLALLRQKRGAAVKALTSLGASASEIEERLANARVDRAGHLE